MATKDRVTIELYVDDQGTIRIREAKTAIEQLGPAGERSGRQMAAAVADATAKTESLGNQLLALTGFTLSVAGAAYAVERAFDTWKSLVTSGIEAVDDYNKSIISSAAMMTNLTNAEITPNLAGAYGQWKDYFQWLWVQSIEADKKVAASGREIFETAKELAKKSVVATSQEQVVVIGRLTDFIKSVSPMTQGEGGARNVMQIKSEIEALMTGQVRATAQTAVALKQIDENFINNIKRARQMGTVLEYLDSLLQGQKYAVRDMANTWDSVSASLSATWQQVRISAFGAAYDDVVRFGQALMETMMTGGRLTERGEKLADALGLAWVNAKDRVAGLLSYLADETPKAIKTVESLAGAVGTIGGAAATTTIKVAELINEFERAAKNPFFQMLMGGALGSRLGPWGAVAGMLPGATDLLASGGHFALGIEGRMPEAGESLVAARMRRYWDSSLGLEPLPSLKKYLDKAPSTPPLRPFMGDVDKGGGGKDSTRSIENLIDRLSQDLSRLTEGKFAEVDKWYAHVVNQVGQWATTQAEADRAMELAGRTRVAKLQKVEEDYQNWLGKANHDTTVKIIDDGITALNKWGDTEKRRTEIAAAINKQLLEEHQKLEIARGQETKKYYDSLAQGSVLVKDQFFWKERSLALEIDLAKKEQERWLVGKGLTDIEKNQYRSLLALTNQAKAYNQEREKEVQAGTLTGWAIERSRDSMARGQTTMKDMLSGAENYIAQAFSSGIQGVLSRDKKSLQEMGKTIVQGFVLEMQKRTVTKVFDELAKLLAPRPKSFAGLPAGGEGNNEAYDWNEGLQRWIAVADTNRQAGLQGKMAAGGLTTSADQGLLSANQAMMSNIQLGLGAASLGVGALSLITGCKELTYATLALQAAALLLQLAGAMDAIPFFHSGGMVPVTYAHTGLSLLPDERLIVAQTGEGILPRAAMSKLGPGMFEILRRGAFTTGPTGGGSAPGGGPVAAQHVSNITIVTPDGTVLGKHQITQIIGAVEKRLSHREIRVPRARRG